MSLSATNEKDDMQMELEDYKFYEYKDQVKFDAALDYAISQAKRKTMVPKIGESYYDDISAKDKVSLSERETNIYYAEVNYSISEFIDRESRRAMYRQKAYRETESQSNVSRSTSGASGKQMASLEYFQIANNYMSAAGYDMLIKMGRRFPVYNNEGSDDSGSFI